MSNKFSKSQNIGGSSFRAAMRVSTNSSMEEILQGRTILIAFDAFDEQ